MTLEGLSSAGPAQRSLARLLRTAFNDEARAILVLQRALRDAGVRTLPTDSERLLGFVKLHLAPRMTAVVGPRLVAALLEDLEAEIEHERAGVDPNSSSRMGIATKHPPPTEASYAGKLHAPPSLTDLVTPLQEQPTPNLAMHHHDDGPELEFDPFEAPTREVPVFDDEAIARQERALAARPKNVRPAVILVDPDRFGRAALARALVQGQCDVTVLDSAAEVVAAVQSVESLDVLVTEIDGIEVEAMLRAVAAARPQVPVIVWTKSAGSVAEHVLQSARIRTFDVVQKGARNVELVELVKRRALR